MEGGGITVLTSYIIYPKCANTESQQCAKNGKMEKWCKSMCNIFTCHIQDHTLETKKSI